MRHNLHEADLFEAKLKRRSRRLRGEPLSPERPCQPPTDFDGRREAGREADVQQSDSPRVLRGSGGLQSALRS
jgi:hypothetical protein